MDRLSHIAILAPAPPELLPAMSHPPFAAPTSENPIRHSLPDPGCTLVRELSPARGNKLAGIYAPDLHAFRPSTRTAVAWDKNRTLAPATAKCHSSAKTQERCPTPLLLFQTDSEVFVPTISVPAVSNLQQNWASTGSIGFGHCQPLRCPAPVTSRFHVSPPALPSLSYPASPVAYKRVNRNFALAVAHPVSHKQCLGSARSVSARIH